MSQPGVWSPRDLQHILGDFGIFVIERAGTDIDEALDNLRQWQDKIHCIPNLVPNEISSTKIRLLVKRQLGIDYLTPDDVIHYIVDHGLYRQDPNDPNVPAAPEGKGKEKAQSSSY
jgi:nicotinamide mononucleotide adenylyltransferase